MNLKHKSIQKLNFMSQLIFKRSGHWRKLMKKGALIPTGRQFKVHQPYSLRAVYTAMAATIAQGAQAWNKSASSSSPSDSNAPSSQAEAKSETQPSSQAEPGISNQDLIKASTT